MQQLLWYLVPHTWYTVEGGCGTGISEATASTVRTGMTHRHKISFDQRSEAEKRKRKHPCTAIQTHKEDPLPQYTPTRHASIALSTCNRHTSSLAPLHHHILDTSTDSGCLGHQHAPHPTRKCCPRSTSSRISNNTPVPPTGAPSTSSNTRNSSSSTRTLQTCRTHTPRMPPCTRT